MSVSSIGVATFGSAAIASPPATDPNVRREDKPAEAPADQIIEAAKPAGTGQLVDKTA
jgi:hypothetical protein